MHSLVPQSLVSLLYLLPVVSYGQISDDFNDDFDEESFISNSFAETTILEFSLNLRAFSITTQKASESILFKNLSKSGKIVNAYNALIMASKSRKK